MQHENQVHANRVNLVNTYKTENEKSSLIVPCFSATPYTGVQEKRSDKVHR